MLRHPRCPDTGLCKGRRGKAKHGEHRRSIRKLRIGPTVSSVALCKKIRPTPLESRAACPRWKRRVEKPTMPELPLTLDGGRVDLNIGHDSCQILSAESGMDRRHYMVRHVTAVGVWILKP